MARTSKTGFDRYFTKRMKDPSFAAQHKSAREETDAIDSLVRSLDAARESAGLTKAALANRADMKPEQVRRIFTAKASNPTVAILVKLPSALKLHGRSHPRTGRRSKRALAAREVALNLDPGPRHPWPEQREACDYRRPESRGASRSDFAIEAQCPLTRSGCSIAAKVET